ncbi:MAG TPA: type III pantothenate kinase [Gammaproteobacteria bacterium]|nr:type III pantothenate kinase [Gammaproteobacteria bacterium]
MNLLIDIGNSRCKWALASTATGSQARLAASGRLDPDGHLDAQLETIEKNSGAPQRATIACVGGKDVLNTVLDAMQDRWPRLDIRQFKTSARALGVTNAYLQPETLGADRWAALIAARALLPSSSAVIVNCGTAVTLDVLDAQGLHQGGYILPGLKLMREALHQGTAALPLAEGREELRPARNTHGAIVAGTVLGIVAAVESQVKAQPGDVECLLAGGDAETIARNLSIACRYEPDLVLKGLAIAAAAEA